MTKKTYARTCIDGLKRELKLHPREQRTQTVKAFRLGLEWGIAEQYPTFACTTQEPTIRDSSFGAYALGYNISQQIGPLEVGLAKKRLLEETDKILKRLEEPNYAQRILDFFEDAYTGLRETAQALKKEIEFSVLNPNFELSFAHKKETPKPKHECHCGPDAPCKRDGICRCALNISSEGLTDKLGR